VTNTVARDARFLRRGARSLAPVKPGRVSGHPQPRSIAGTNAVGPPLRSTGCAAARRRPSRLSAALRSIRAAIVSALPRCASPGSLPPTFAKAPAGRPTPCVLGSAALIPRPQAARLALLALRRA